VLNNETTRFPIGMPTSGKIVGVGTRAVPGFSFLSAIRLNENGSYDVRFATEGVFEGGSVVTALTKHNATFSAGDKVVIGVARYGGNNASMRLVRLTTQGDIDPTFTGVASTVHYLGPVNSGFARDGVDAAVLIQPFDNKIVSAGTCNMNTSAAPVWKFCVARYHGGPPIDGCSMDIDGDGAVLATTDSLIHARIALGISGSSAVSGINFPPTATRKTWPDIRDYLGATCGMSLAP
jgi:hypothetical protein